MSDQVELNPHIFRAYDIRGDVGPDLNPSTVELIGRAYGTHLRREYDSSRIVVVRDNRPSSEGLREAFVAGVTAVGVSVVEIGVGPSPLMYFAAAAWGIDGGAAITASHSPTRMNGLKLLERDGIPLSPEEIQRVFELARDGDFVRGTGSVEDREPLPEYLAMLEKRFRLSRPLRVVADPGNGVATLTGPEALRRIGCEVEVINGESDGTFPRHLPNPQDPATMEELCGEVVARGADLGVAWDGDGDRVGIVDERGVRLEADTILAILARDALTRHPGAEILVDVKTSLSAMRDIEAHGGRVVIGKTGHSLGKRAMREHGYPFGGEAAAHFYFGENYKLDDGVYASAAMAWIVAESGGTASEAFVRVPEFVSSAELALPCEDRVKFKVASKVADHFGQDYDVLTLDGARVSFPDDGTGDGWALVRASNTGPILTVRFEATSEARYASIRATVLEELARYPEVTIPEGIGER